MLMRVWDTQKVLFPDQSARLALKLIAMSTKKKVSDLLTLISTQRKTISKIY
jgi:hypothetical protein